MQKTEAQFTTKFRDWLVYAKKFYPAAYEIKATKTKTIPVSAVKPHQLEALMAVKHGRFYYKIPDDGFAQKPFDCFTLNGEAYIVLAFIEPYKTTEFYIIDIDKYVELVDLIGRKSFTKEALDKFNDYTMKHSLKAESMPKE